VKLLKRTKAFVDDCLCDLSYQVYQFELLVVFQTFVGNGEKCGWRFCGEPKHKHLGSSFICPVYWSSFGRSQWDQGLLLMPFCVFEMYNLGRITRNSAL
jgi:hypothetical protein